MIKKESSSKAKTDTVVSNNNIVFWQMTEAELGKRKEKDREKKKEQKERTLEIILVSPHARLWLLKRPLRRLVDFSNPLLHLIPGLCGEVNNLAPDHDLEAVIRKNDLALARVSLLGLGSWVHMQSLDFLVLVGGKRRRGERGGFPFCLFLLLL